MIKGVLKLSLFLFKIICCGCVLKSPRGAILIHTKTICYYVLWMCIRIAEVIQIQPYDFMETL